MKPSDDDLSRIETLALLWKQLSTLVRRSQIYYPTRPTRFSFFWPASEESLQMGNYTL